MGVGRSLSWIGALLAGLALLDPRFSVGPVLGPALALAGLCLERLNKRPLRQPALLAVLAGAFAIGSLSAPELLRADSAGYYAYLRSGFFDWDLDFANEWRAWNLPEQPLTPTGHRYNQLPVGPALVWSPFFVLAHTYVRVGNLFGFANCQANGFSPPYLRSMALGTITLVVLGGWLLADELRRRLGKTPAVLGVAGAITVSPLLFYVFVQPGMAHGIAFALACGFVFVALRADAGSGRAWIAAGALLGLLVMTRMQSFAYLVLLVPAAIRELRQRKNLRWLAGGALLAMLTVAPQLIAWKILYGSFFRIPEGPGMTLPSRVQSEGWFDWSSPHLADVLFSADHGLFTWTPGVLLGVIGLLPAARRYRGLAIGGLLIFAATTWLNGARTIDWSGDDAFGARRFDLVLPFVALGFTALLEICSRRPLLAPTALLVFCTVWNLGLIRLFRTRVFTEAAPIEALTARQFRQLRRLSERAADRLAGPAGRAFVYNLFVGEFFYWNLNLGATIDLGDPDPRYLAGGWSSALNRHGPPTFRWAEYPTACVRFPLRRARWQGLRAEITARAPGRVENQTMSVVLNGLPLDRALLDTEWKTVAVILPGPRLVTGENLLCLAFSQPATLPDGSQVGAAVSRIQLP